MKEFLKKNKISVLICAYIVLMTVIFYFLIRPIVNEIAAKADMIQQKKYDKEVNENKLAAMLSAEKNFNEINYDKNDFNNTINTGGEVELIKDLEILAEQTGNKIEFKLADNQDKKPASKPKKDEVDIKKNLKHTNYLSLQVALEGSYISLVNFMHKLENYKKYVNVISISSEKMIIADSSSNLGIIATSDLNKKKAPDKEVINTILDAVIYIKN